MRESRRKAMIDGLHHKKGYLAYQSEKIDEAIHTFKLTRAKRQIKDLLKSYPEDRITKNQLARIFILEHSYEAAKELLQDIEEYTNSFNLLTKICIKLNDEEELQRLYQKYYQNDRSLDPMFAPLSERNYKDIKLYLDNKYHCFDETIREDKNLGYYEKQMIKYSKEEALDHIFTRHFSPTLKRTFSSSIDIEQLLNKMQDSILPNQRKSYISSRLSEMYQFYYKDAGFDSRGLPTDYIKVVTLVNSNHIITMYPCQYLDYFDVCHIEKQDDHTNHKVMIKNGMERFNNRYR